MPLEYYLYYLYYLVITYSAPSVWSFRVENLKINRISPTMMDTYVTHESANLIVAGEGDNYEFGGELIAMEVCINYYIVIATSRNVPRLIWFRRQFVMKASMHRPDAYVTNLFPSLALQLFISSSPTFLVDGRR